MNSKRTWIAVTLLMLLLGTFAYFAGGELDPVRTTIATPRAAGAGAHMRAHADETVDFSNTDGPLLRLRIRLAEDTGSALDEVLVNSELLTHAGVWSTVSSTITIRYPERYDPPTVPALATEPYTGGGNRGDPNPVLLTNPGNLFIPPHPENFQEKEVGITLRVRPSVSPTGEISVETEIDRSALIGFVEDGTPLEVKTSTSPITAPMFERQLDNLQRLPVFLHQHETLTFLESDERLKIEGLEPDALLPVATDFAEEHRQENLPELELIIEAEEIPPAPATPASQSAGTPQIYLTSRILEITTDTTERPSLTDEFGSLFTDPQFQLVIRALNTRKRIDMLSAPSIMMLPGQMGTIEVSREFIYPGNYSPAHSISSTAGYPVTPSTPIDFTTEQTGIIVKAAARPTPGGMIDLQFNPQVSEFLGFLNFGEVIATEGKSMLGGKVPVVLTENRIEQPIFSTWNRSSTVRIPDGSTILLEGPTREEEIEVEDRPPFIGDLPFIGDASATRRSITTYRHIYFFLTPKLVDSSGKPINPSK